MITVPLGVLQAGSIRFHPELPDLLAAIGGLEMGQALRITLRFREPFWERREGLSDLGFIHSGAEPFPTWWTALPVHVPMITGWAAGPAAERLAGLGESVILERALSTLATLLGVSRSDLGCLLEAWYFHDWQSDPYAQGSYSYVLVGGSSAQEKLATPVEETLYFAGEAVDTEGHSGTVHGAIASAERAAEAILESRRA